MKVRPIDRRTTNSMVCGIGYGMPRVTIVVTGALHRIYGVFPRTCDRTGCRGTCT